MSTQNTITYNDIINAEDKNAMLFKYLEAGNSFNIKIYKLLSEHVERIPVDMNVWNNFCANTDYNLTLFIKRRFPSFQSESKEWKSAGIRKTDYPLELTDKENTDSIYKKEIKQISTENNFSSWSIPAEFTDLKEICKQLEIIKSVDNELFIKAITKYMINPMTAHIIFEPVWKLLNEFMSNETINEMVRYAMSYAMMILKHEETVYFGNVKPVMRVLISHDKASMLPTFTEHMLKSPYLIQLTDDTEMLHTMPFYLYGERSITSPEVFKKRFELLTGGAFEGIDLTKYEAAITGSILIPCVQVNPLEKLFEGSSFDVSRKEIYDTNSYMTTDITGYETFMKFAEYYFPSYVSLSDADYVKEVISNLIFKRSEHEIIVNEDDSVDTIEHTKDSAQKDAVAQLKTINTQLKSDIEAGAARPSRETIERIANSVQETTPLLPDQRRQFSAYDDDDFTVDVVEDTVSSATTKSSSSGSTQEAAPATATYWKPQHEETKKIISDALKERIEKARKLRMMVDEVKETAGIAFNQLSDIDVSISTTNIALFEHRAIELFKIMRKNCANRGPIFIDKVKTITNIKFKVYGPGIPRPVDIFNIPYNATKMVKDFHLSCVKMFYDGQLHIFRSCVSSLLTGAMESYRWFSCNKVPADVLFKYVQRGFTTMLNTKDRNHLTKYLQSNERWQKIFTDCNIKPEEIFNCFTIKHKFFRPGNSGMRLGLRNFEPIIETDNTPVNITTTDVRKYGNILTHDTKRIIPPNLTMIQDAITQSGI